MSYLKLEYSVTGKASPGVLHLDLLGQRWNVRTMIHAVVTHEFPSYRSEPMKGPEWSPERVLERFGITHLRYAFIQEGRDDPNSTPLLELRVQKRRVRQCQVQ